MTEQGYIKNFEGDKRLPETTSALVTDLARSQALSASLMALVEKNALGYPDFTTTDDWPAGTQCFYDRRLWNFTSDHAAGDWDANDVEEFSVKEYMDAIAARVTNVEENYARKDGFYDQLTAGNAVNILAEGLITEQAALGVTAPEDEVGDGMSAIQEIHGDGVVWNQLYKTDGLTTETAQLNDLATRVVHRFSNTAGTTPMGALFVREKLTNHEFAEVPTTKTGEGFIPAVTEDNKSDYTGIHYFVRATHADVVTKEENADATSAFFIYGSTARQVQDMAVMFGIAGVDRGPFRLPTTAPSTWAQMMAWLGQKVGIAEAYDFCESNLIGVTQLAKTSMPGTNLLNPTAGVALCPYYAWGDNSGLYRIHAPSGTTISSVVAEALSGQEVAVVAVTAGSVYEVVVPEGDACVITVSVSAGSLASCAVWQVWDDATLFGDIAAYSQDSLFFSVGRIYGKLNGEGSLVKVENDGVCKGASNAHSVLDVVNDEFIIKMGYVDLGSLYWDISTAGQKKRFLSSSIRTVVKPPIDAARTANILCKNYAHTNFSNTFYAYLDRIIAITGENNSNARGYVNVVDSVYSDVSAFKTAMNGIYLWYELATPVVYSDLHYDISASGDGSELVPLAEAFNHNLRIGNMGVNLDTTNWNASTNRFSADPVGVAPETVSQMPSNIVEQVDTNRQFNENLRTSLPTALAAAGVTGITIDVDGTASYSA